MTEYDAIVVGARSFKDAMAAYHSERDRQSFPFYEFTTELATLQPLPAELERVLDAVSGDQEAMDGFARVGGAVTSPADFFSEENGRRLLAGARAGRAGSRPARLRRLRRS